MFINTRYQLVLLCDQVGKVLGRIEWLDTINNVAENFYQFDPAVVFFAVINIVIEQQRRPAFPMCRSRIVS